MDSRIIACHYHDLEPQNHYPGTRRGFDGSVVECRKRHDVVTFLWCFDLCLAFFLSLLTLFAGALHEDVGNELIASHTKQHNGAFGCGFMEPGNTT